MLFFLPSAHQNGRWPGKVAEIDPSLCASGRHTFIPFHIHSITHIPIIVFIPIHFNSFIAGQITNPRRLTDSSFHPLTYSTPNNAINSFSSIIDHPIRFNKTAFAIATHKFNSIYYSFIKMQYTKIIEGQLPMKPIHGIMIRNWQEDVVNLVQFPRTHTIVSPSMFALKLETWLRMNEVKYHVCLGENKME